MVDHPQDQLILLLITGSIGVLCMAIFIVLIFFVYQKRMFISEQHNQKMKLEFQQRMVQLQLESQEQERIRISSDLHDSVGSLLWAAKVNATYVERSINLEMEVKSAFEEMSSALDQAVHLVRRIAWELTPEAFQHTGLSHSLKGLCQRLNGKGIQVEFEELGSPITWNDNRALQVFRIGQELTTNVVKHAQASFLRMELHWLKDQARLLVIDDGTGFLLTESHTGVGWWNIHQRALKLKATIDMGVPPMKKGSMISITIPLTYEKQPDSLLGR
jgi:two-component system, NarL family, sensor kinase